MDELFIQAGLQDRVIQTYEGCMFMDFDKALIDERGFGAYERLPTANLPPLWLAYLSDPSNSGKIHSDVKARWKAGEPRIVEGMKQFANLTDEGRAALLRSDWRELGRLMDANFALRRELYAADHVAPTRAAGFGDARTAGACSLSTPPAHTTFLMRQVRR
jgi:glucuronokinase